MRRERDEDVPAAWERCPRCRARFQVLADELGMHDCPSCGYGRDDNEDKGVDMPSYKEHFGGYLKQEDIDRPIRVVVESVSIEDVKNDDGTKARKLVARFAGKNKAMVLNKTNAEAIATEAGQENYDYWAGTVMTLWADPNVKMGTKVVGGLRLVKYTPATSRPAPTPPPAPPPVLEEEFDSNDAPPAPPSRRAAAPVVTDDDIPF